VNPWLVIGILIFVSALVFKGSLMASTGNTSGNYSGEIVAFAKAIAKAEGFGIPGKIPTLANNPGDLEIPGWMGQKLGEGISVFSSANEGWDRLYRQLQLIVNGESVEYSLSDTIQTMASKWTKTDSTTWALIVSSTLGVSADTPLSEVLGG
jgi:hypothetical protein